MNSHTQEISTASSNQLALDTQILRKFGINSFVHDITFGKGEISTLTDRKEIYDFYFKTRYPALCTNEDGRMLQPGIYIDSALRVKDASYDQLITPIGLNFKFNHMLHIAENDKDCQHLYSFTFDIGEYDFIHLIINNINRIKGFITRHRKVNHDLITEFKKSKNRYSLPFSNKTLKNINSHYNDIQSKTRGIIKLNSGKELTQKELQILSWMHMGKTINQISEILNIAEITIKKHVANIKCKTNCYTQFQLGEFFNRLSSL